MKVSDIPKAILEQTRRGTAIPALPLALDENRKFDEKYEKALARYYIDAGAGGLAVGVHSTQFEIRDPDVKLFEPVLKLASETIDTWLKKKSGAQPFLKVAGICGKTKQALAEAEFAVKTGYHAGLLSLAAMKDTSIKEMVEHCREVSNAIPLIGFYLQPSVGGRPLPYEFWRGFFEIENVLAVKMAPFNRYQTFDVVRALCESGRENEVTLYTGNDDNIVVDLLSEYRIQTSRGAKQVRIKGGLLGHWAMWTHNVVALLRNIHDIVENNKPIPPALLTAGIEITDCNAVFFDFANGFHGCIPGIHEVLRRQGLLRGTWCLNPKEVLSPGQSAEIDRVYAAYPHLNDDAFVKDNLKTWLEE
ncbi:MAG: dihydrodipicolinate synthase family protein [Spirochaetia bacterium]|nr:dihydrodipicolinate synthase family protein [Spirochaetia bacterium]